MICRVLKGIVQRFSSKRILPPYVEGDTEDMFEWQSNYAFMTKMLADKGIRNIQSNMKIHNRKKGENWVPTKMRRFEQKYLNNFRLQDNGYDDLRFDPKYIPLQPYVDQFKSRDQFIRPTPIVYSRFLYNAVRCGACQEKYFKRLDTVLYHYEGNFPPRFAYGALVASLFFNYNSMQFNDFMKNHLPKKLNFIDFIQLMDAAAGNLVAPVEWRKDLIAEYLEPLLSKFNQQRSQSIIGKNYFKNLTKLQMTEDKYWQRHLARFKCRGVRGALNLINWLPFNRLDQDYIKEAKEYLSQNQNVRWRFNLEENRLYTNAEMIAKSQDQIATPTLNSLVRKGRIQKANENYRKAIEKGLSMADEERKSLNSKKMLKLLEDKFTENAMIKGDLAKSVADPQFLQMLGITEQQFKADLKQLEEQLDTPDAGQSVQAAEAPAVSASSDEQEQTQKSKGRQKGKKDRKK